MDGTSILSIIVPNYNNEKYIEKCLESILSQTYKNIEIVIIDDASTDKSIDIINGYKKKYSFIKVIYNKQNQGVTRNRDSAIKASIGNYITTLDSDDFYINNTKLEKEMKIIKINELKNKKNIIAFSNIVLVDTMGKELSVDTKNNIKEGNIFINLFTRDCMVPRDFIFTKKQYQEAGGYDLKIPIYEDWDLKLRLACKNEFYYTGVDGIGYRRHGTGLSSADSSKHIKWLRYIYKKNIKIVEKNKQNYVYERLDKFFQKAFHTSLKINFNQKIKNIFQNKNIRGI